MDVNMSIASYDACCGCGNCSLVCKKDAIKVSVDEAGFYKRVYEPSRCVHCHACEKVCPITSRFEEYKTSLGVKAYYGYCLDREVLGKTSSGGIASALAGLFLESDNSVVYGCSYTKGYKSAEMVRIVNSLELDKLYGSKYIQSCKNNIFEKLKRDLQRDFNVLFIGLPCDVAALKLYLKKTYSNLITCELVCHGTGSTRVLNEYLEYFRKKAHSDISIINMRYKRNRIWKPYYFYIHMVNGKEYFRNYWESEFGFAFSMFRNTSCYSCIFKSDNRYADITLGDAWGAPNELLENNKGGLSSILVNSEAGEKYIDELFTQNWINIFETTKESIIKGNPNLEKNETIPEKYNELKESICKRGLFKTERKYRPLRTRSIIAVKRLIESLKP